MSETLTLAERAKIALGEGFGEQLKARFNWLNGDVESQSDHIKALAGDVVKFENGLRDLKLFYERAEESIDKVFGVLS
jgi:hypothetical protein